MALRKLCKECPNYSTCVAICSKVEEELSRLLKESKSDEILGFYKDSGDSSNINITSAMILIIKKKISSISLIIQKKKSPDNNFKYDALTSNFPDEKLGYISRKEFDRLMEHLFYRTNDEDKKNKLYFVSFLRCAKIIKVANLAGCIRQNMQKKFQGWIRKAGKIFSKEFHKIFSGVVTPAKFKKYLILT